MILIGDMMTKEECWQKFTETGKIEYYLEYKRLSRESLEHDKGNRRNSRK